MTQFNEGHGLLLPFDTDEPLFTRGFEAGRIWACLTAMTAIDDDWDERDATFTVHWSNAEMMQRIAESLGLTVKANGDPFVDPSERISADEVWTEVTFLLDGVAA